MRVGTFSPSVLLRVSRRAGALERHGLTGVEEIAVPSSPAQFRALAEGSLDAALTSPDNVLAYRTGPANPLGRVLDVRILSGVDHGLGLAVYGRPGVTEVGELRDAVVGVDVAASGFAFAAYELLARAGLRAGSDYTVVELGSTPKRLVALQAGECDATMLNAGNDLRADAAGLPKLARLVDAVRPYLGTVLAVAGTPRPPARALAVALKETAREVLAGRLSELVLEEAEGTGLAPALARAYARRLIDPDEGLVVDGGTRGLDAVIDLRHRHGSGPATAPEGLVDPSVQLL